MLRMVSLHGTDPPVRMVPTRLWAIGHGLQAGPHQLCRCCRQPLPEGARDAPEFELGVSCPRCYASTSPAQKDGARERQRQWERAKVRARAQLAQLADEDGP